MERLNGLYRISEASFAEGRYSARIVLNAEHEVYKGHFPGYPVTPGVIQMHIVNDLLSHFIKRSLRLYALSTCKFLKVLNPADFPEIDIHITWKEHSGLVLAEATGQHGGNLFFKMNPVYEHGYQ